MNTKQVLFSLLSIFLIVTLVSGEISLTRAAGNIPASQDSVDGVSGDDYADLVIGVPGRAVGPTLAGGGVSLVYGTEGGLQAAGSEWWDQFTAGGGENPDSYDEFGKSLAAGDFDGNGSVDLAIGVPGEAVNGQANAGAVNVIYQDPEGWRPVDAQLWSEASFGDEQVQAEEYFGTALAAGDFNLDGFDDLAIGVPGQDFVLADIGALRVVFGSSQGLTLQGDLFFAQAPFGLGDMIEGEDNFGEVLAAGDFDGDGYDDLVIGVPQEDIDETVDAGLVHVVPGGPGGFDTAHELVLYQGADIQGVPGVQDYFGFSLATGDFDGNGYDDLVIGVPMEDHDETNDGVIQVLYGAWFGLDAEFDMMWWQDLLVSGESEENDFFGVSLAAGDFNGDGRDDLAVGASYEKVGEAPDEVDNAGAVFIMYGDFSGEDYDRFEKETPEPYEYYGAKLAAGDFDADGYWDLAVGSPMKNGDSGQLDAGSVHVMYGDTGGLSLSLDQIMDLQYTNSLEPEENDHFGFALVALTGPRTSLQRVFLPLLFRNMQ